MKIIIAPDSFKGSLSSSDVSSIISTAAFETLRGCKPEKIAVADGGEGTVAAVLGTLTGKEILARTSDPMGIPLETYYGVFSSDEQMRNDCAIVEMAAASGFHLVKGKNANIMSLNTYGTGRLFMDAVERGHETIFVGIGGSATNDGGIGFAAAIGARFFDESGSQLAPVPDNFAKVARIDTSGIPESVRKVKVIGLCDVNNPLLGEYGATRVFGPQKGASFSELATLENGMSKYIRVVEQTVGRSVAGVAGAGAGGGLGAALLAFTDCKLVSGVETILDMISFRKQIAGADLVITGEGSMDQQTQAGKVAYGVGRAAREMGVPCIALVGSMGRGAEEMYNNGISSIFTIMSKPMTEEEALRNADMLTHNAAVRMFKMIKVGMDMNK